VGINVKYLLIGGYAVGYHGYPRPTGDMDLWIANSSENAHRVKEALLDFGFASVDTSDSLFLEKDRVIRMGVPPMRIEIVTGISGVFFDECYTKRITPKIDEIEVNIIALDDLKINKKASGRLKDLTDLEYLP
jgi:hypothetical protein